MKELPSEGKCVYCEKKYSRSGISRHLATHLKKLEQEKKSTKKAYHIKVSAGEMFLHLLAAHSTTFGQLNDFLRAIWLECCGHLSSFRVKEKQYYDDWDSNEFGEKMSWQLSKTLKKGIKLEYDYDFGSTTRLEISVITEYKINVPDYILLLSRNEPLPILCHECKKKPALNICSVCMYSGPSLFCKSCSKKHEKTCEDFEDYASMPVVNSPRMGVCAYEGGEIDLERDGIWKK